MQSQPENLPPEFDVALKSSSDRLSSECGIDYTHLRDLLAVSQWKEAMEETESIMLKLVTREQVGWLRSEDIAKLPCTDLNTIDRLWVKYSHGRFGFSVQKRIWQDLGSTSSQALLGEHLGWYLKDTKQWLFGSSLNYTQNAPIGHLPRLGVWWQALFSRLDSCGL